MIRNQFPRIEDQLVFKKIAEFTIADVTVYLLPAHLHVIYSKINYISILHNLFAHDLLYIKYAIYFNKYFKCTSDLC